MRSSFRCAASALAAIALVGASASPSLADLITIGTNNGAPNIFPLGAPPGPIPPAYSGEYQQIYTATAFSGPVTITGIAFATAITAGAGNSVTDAFTLGLSTTSASLLSPSTTYATNRGADFTEVFSGTMTITAQGTGAFDVFIPLAPFSYNPAAGNLLLDIDVTSSVGLQVALDSTTRAVTTRIFNAGGNGAPTVQVFGGLVTQFTTVPEPSSLALCGLGAAGVAGLIRRRKALG